MTARTSRYGARVEGDGAPHCERVIVADREVAVPALSLPEARG